MADFEVTVLGVGDTFSELHRSTSVLLSCDGYKLAIDCPDMYRGALRAAAERCGRELSLFDLDGLLITRVPGDHMNGLEGVAFFKRFAQNRKLRLVTSAEVRANVWDERLKASMGALWDGQHFRELGFDDYFEHVSLGWSGETVVGPF